MFTNQKFAPPGTPNIITNRIWDEDQIDVLEVGQAPLVTSNFVQDARWQLPAVALGAHQCNPQWFATGEPWPTSLPPTVYYGGWIPACCLEVEMCITDLCAKDPINSAPASQHTQFAVDAVDATATTPAVQFVVGESVAGPGPFVPAALLRGLPQGTGGLAQYVEMTEGTVKLVAQRGAVQAAIGVSVNGAGVPQFVLENVGIPTTAITGLPWSIAQGGTGATTAAGARVNLGLGTAAVENVGTSGHTVPFLDEVNTWSGSQLLLASSAGVQPFFSQALSFDDHSTAAPLRAYSTFAGNTAVGFGVRFELGGKVGSTATQTFLTFAAVLTDATFATWKSRGYFYIGGATTQEYMSAANLGGTAGIGFLGATPVAMQSGDIGAALVAFGLMTGTPSFAGNSATATLAAEAVVLETPRTINGVSFDGSANIEVRLPATNTAGELVCSAFTITGTSGTYQATGNKFTLPAAGTYLITGRVCGFVQAGAAGYHFVNAKLRNNTAGADLANSDIMCAATLTNGEFNAGSASFTAVVTVGASTEFELYASRTGTSWSISTINSDASGWSVFDWLRLF